MNTILAFTGAALAFHLFCGVVSAGFFSPTCCAMGVVGLLIAWACETTYGWKRFW